LLIAPLDNVSVVIASLQDSGSGHVYESVDLQPGGGISALPDIAGPDCQGGVGRRLTAAHEPHVIAVEFDCPPFPNDYYLVEVDVDTGQSVSTTPTSTGVPTQPISKLSAVGPGRYLAVVGGSCSSLAIIATGVGLMSAEVVGLDDLSWDPMQAFTGESCHTSVSGAFSNVAVNPTGTHALVILVNPTGHPVRGTGVLRTAEVADTALLFDTIEYSDSPIVAAAWVGDCIAAVTVDNGTHHLLTYMGGSLEAEVKIDAPGFPIAIAALNDSTTVVVGWTTVDQDGTLQTYRLQENCGQTSGTN